jgi:hypothetical protein
MPQNLASTRYVAGFTNRQADGSARFYMHDPYSRREPLILVPTVQFEQFLSTANANLHTHLCIPGGANEEKFIVARFNAPFPRFAGRVSDEAAYKSLKDTLIGAPWDDLLKLDKKSLNDFKEQMDRVYDSFKSSKSKSKKNPEIQRMKQVLKQKDWGRITKRVQRYLGLRQRSAYEKMSRGIGNIPSL